MADLVVKVVDLDGMDPETPAYVAAEAGTELFLNDGYTFLHYINGATQETTVIIDSVTPCNQGVDHNAGGVVPVSEQRMFGPFQKGRFNNAAGKIAVTYTGGVVNLTVAAIRVMP